MKPLLVLTLLLTSGTFAFAQDITTLEKIGDVVSLIKTDKSVTLICQDNSQVQLTILAPDLIRVRASFTKPIPTKDHSWAIAKTEWTTPRWSVNESTTSITITTDELEVTIQRPPLLISFSDARTHQLLNADERPMSYDAKSSLAGMMFDPKAGPFVAAAKKLRVSTSAVAPSPTGIQTRPAISKAEIPFTKPFRSTSVFSAASLTASFSTTVIAAILILGSRLSSVRGLALKAVR